MIIKKIFYMVEFETVSPLSVGNGLEETTKHDVLRNGSDKPFIPGTSLAGAFLSCLSNEEIKIFNPTLKIEKTKKEKNVISPFFVSDAKLIESNGLSIRDGIEVDENKVTKKGAKYDIEILEAGAKFQFRIEINVSEKYSAKKMEKIVNKILANINRGDILFGTKIRTGFGKVKIIAVYNKSFEKKDLESYLKFDKYNKNLYDKIKIQDLEESKYDTITVKLKQLGGLSIRTYSAKGGDVDSRSLTSNGKPVIPGSSWKGAITKQIKYYDKIFKNEKYGTKIEDYLGYVNGNDAQASNIIVEESIINNGKMITMTRNKIDRFAGGNADRALFNEEVIFNGNTALTFKIKKEVNGVKNDYVKTLIYLVIKDIENGLLAIGGLTAIGRGIFKVEEVKENGVPCKVENGGDM